MILENQSQSDASTSVHSPAKNVFQGNFDHSFEESQLSRMKSDFHNKIRIRELDKIKTEKRRIHQTNLAIQQILHTDFPKQSSDAKNWAQNLMILFKTSKKYETDPYKLRDIFLLAEKFPSLGTLRVFYLAIISTSTQNIRTLFDLDIWKFLHNILQFPSVRFQEKQSTAQIDKESFSPCSKCLNTKFVEVEVVKAAIETFVCLFKKDIAFRDYSVEIHCTFSNYLFPACRKYGESIKTEVIYFLKAVFDKAPKKYSKQYLSIVKLTFYMLVEYRQKFTIFFTKKEWSDQQAGETIQEVIKRAGNLTGVMCKLFQYIENRWLYDFVNNFAMSKNQNYLDIMNIYLNFGQCVIRQLYSSDKGIPQYYELLQSAIDFMHNTFMFYLNFVEKNIIDGPQNTHLIPEIMRKVVSMLSFIKKCQENKIFSEAKRQLLLGIQKTKQICLFTIDNALNSEFDSYKSFAKNFIFCKEQDGEQINLLTILNYLLNTVHYEKVLSQLINVVFSLLKLKIPQQELNDYMILRQITEKVWEMLGDKIVVDDTKVNICHQFMLLLDENHEDIGSLLRIKDVVNKSYSKIEEFMYGQMCNHDLFVLLEQVIKMVKNNWYDPHQNSVLI